MSDKHSSNATEHFNKLIQFRQAAYQQMGQARDALFELTDAVIQKPHIQSFVELSQAPVFRRKWSSAYEALQDGRPKRAGLMDIYLQHLPEGERLIVSGDHTVWQRLWSKTVAGRSYAHQPTAVAGRRPVTIGHSYSTLAVVPEAQGSWALPLLHERILDRKPVAKAAEQLRQAWEKLGKRFLSLWDAEYGCAAFLNGTQDIPVDKEIRLRTNLCLEGAPRPRTSSRGPTPKHGAKFKFQDPTTWWQPDEHIQYETGEFGPLVVMIWKGLRFSKALDCPMWVARLERFQASGSRRKPRILWFAWVGQEPPERWWELYGRRYPVDHWYRFAKGRLHWTAPRVVTPEQGERWSDLMPFLTWELWLARPIIQDCPLPWQKPLQRLSPGRACQAMQLILPAISTPAGVCKSRGKSPGWPTGKPRTKRQEQPLEQSERWKEIRRRERAKKAAVKAKRGRPKKPKPVDLS